MARKEWDCKQVDAAEFFGVTPPTMTAWIRAGAPVAKRMESGRVLAVNLSDLAQWKIRQAQNRDRDPVAERARRDAEAADKLALENAKTRGQIADVAEVAAVWSVAFSELRTRLRAIPSNAAPSLIGCTREEIRDFLERSIDDALASLADAGPGLEGSAAPAAEADGEPVGGPPPEAEPGIERGAGSVVD